MAIACAPDGAWIASGGRDKVIVVADLETGTERFALKGHSGEIVALNVSPDGSVLASAAQDGQARTWDLVDGRPLAASTFPSEIMVDGFVATSAEFAPDGAWILSGGPAGEVAEKGWNR
jgi:WD40 repeat protein